MALRVELTQWVEGVTAFDNKDHDRALDLFMAIADTAKIHFNIAMTYINMGATDDAIAALGRSVACDPFLAVAYFMRGVCYYNVNALNESLADFNDALTYLRGNTHIDYAQLGLAFKLYACEVSFNRGLCLAAMGQMNDAFKDFEDAARSRPPAAESTEDFRNIDEAMKLGDRAPEYLGPYAVSPDSVYRPPSGRVKNSDKKDYMGKAKVVASVEATDNYAGFSGRELKMKTLPRSNSTNDIPTFPTDKLLRSNTSTGVLGRSATVATPGMPRVVGGGIAPPTLRPLRNRSSSLGQQQPFERAATVGRAPAMSINPIDELMSELGKNDDDRSNYGSEKYGSEKYTPSLNGGYGGSDGGDYRRSEYNRSSSPVGSVSTVADKIKLKAHYKTTRILLLPPIIQLQDLIDRLQDKFNLANDQTFSLRYRDEDGQMVTIIDQEDLEVAWAVQGVEWGEGGRVEVWCEVQ
ncbi:hypothetical protein PhCBS80983_g02500 [Powellomyces hirtus]|uniref:PB1 domain-containing protein n=1 Tax=Powellomyces hirtus TaxID=109895 RepID=A0A507E5K1_9FUNG|nr:hypothetical protein PhCBS80983_g02500 [Powellomyces hirtus]